MVQKLYTYLSIILIFILFLPSAAEAADSIPKGTTVGGVDIGGLDPKKAVEKVQTEMDLWQTGKPLEIVHTEEKTAIPRDSFRFDLKQTLDQLDEKMKRPWYLFFKKPKPAQVPLIVAIDPDMDPSGNWPGYLHKEGTLEKAIERASMLGDAPIEAVYIEEDKAAKGPVAKVKFPMLLENDDDPSDVSIRKLAEELNGQTISANGQFSFIRSVLEPVEQDSFKEEANFVATALYSLSLQTNMAIIERHSQGVIPAYTEAGIEAMVNEADQADLILDNPNPFPYTIKAEVKKDALHLSFLSVVKETEYQYQIENRQEIKPRTVHRFSPDLAPGTSQAAESGIKGVQVEVYRVKMTDGETLDKELISRDFYPPSPTVILVSSQEPPAPEPEEEEKDLATVLEEFLSSQKNNPDSTEEVLTPEETTELLAHFCEQAADEATKAKCGKVLVKEREEAGSSSDEADPEDGAGEKDSRQEMVKGEPILNPDDEQARK